MFSRALESLAYGNLAVAMSAWGYCYALGNTLGWADKAYAFLLFFGTFSAYSYMHLLSARNQRPIDGHPVRVFTQKHARIFGVLGLVSALAAVYFFVRVQAFYRLLATALLPLVLLYPALGKKFGGLRSMKGLKFPLVVGIWILLTAGVPMFFADRAISKGVVFALGLSVSLWIAATAFMFDLRDIHTDRPGLSWAQRLGGRRSINLIRAAYALSAFGFIGVWMAYPEVGFQAAAALLSLLGSIMLCNAYARNNKPLIISLWIELMPAFWGFAVWLGEWARQSFYF